MWATEWLSTGARATATASPSALLLTSASLVGLPLICTRGRMCLHKLDCAADFWQPQRVLSGRLAGCLRPPVLPQWARLARLSSSGARGGAGELPPAGRPTTITMNKCFRRLKNVHHPRASRNGAADAAERNSQASGRQPTSCGYFVRPLLSCAAVPRPTSSKYSLSSGGAPARTKTHAASRAGGRARSPPPAPPSELCGFSTPLARHRRAH